MTECGCVHAGLPERTLPLAVYCRVLADRHRGHSPLAECGSESMLDYQQGHSLPPFGGSSLSPCWTISNDTPLRRIWLSPCWTVSGDTLPWWNVAESMLDYQQGHSLPPFGGSRLSPCWTISEDTPLRRLRLSPCWTVSGDTLPWWNVAESMLDYQRGHSPLREGRWFSPCWTISGTWLSPCWTM